MLPLSKRKSIEKSAAAGQSVAQHSNKAHTRYRYLCTRLRSYNVCMTQLLERYTRWTVNTVKNEYEQSHRMAGTIDDAAAHHKHGLTRTKSSRPPWLQVNSGAQVLSQILNMGMTIIGLSV